MVIFQEKTPLDPLDRSPAFLTSDDFISSNEIVRTNDRLTK